ncbi:hypothetical protein AGABI1DRAFT_127584 [Agaricus bisporus var. burnettii JB137-S8]|uniref:Uncharacterized protein n=1 Tax=Agaricus bisporus var. burnettii (strain JB137-S8 / ATCC MYA-4627 / FGSC 10392) TaxID=597362 RepID=K5VZF6_AGABU|nr:uncharacterized protein AGABI1DRAFT_127584 [Agaricus bisporus var. burnettii JB137-S8]EKM79904.1 hypothetical protein AGABI1DRAFT_127584 [Agaricus bisporus var. burnettii JB137-S8]
MAPGREPRDDRGFPLFGHLRSAIESSELREYSGRRVQKLILVGDNGGLLQGDRRSVQRRLYGSVNGRRADDDERIIFVAIFGSLEVNALPNLARRR